MSVEWIVVVLAFVVLLIAVGFMAIFRPKRPSDIPPWEYE